MKEFEVSFAKIKPGLNGLKFFTAKLLAKQYETFYFNETPCLTQGSLIKTRL